MKYREAFCRSHMALYTSSGVKITLFSVLYTLLWFKFMLNAQNIFNHGFNIAFKRKAQNR